MSHEETSSSAAWRALGTPQPVEVRTDAGGTPVAVARRRRGRSPEWRSVEQIDDAWRVAEEWWRETPQERTYLRVILEGGQPLTLFHDRGQRQWFEQPYAPSPSRGSAAPGSSAGAERGSRSSQRRRT